MSWVCGKIILKVTENLGIVVDLYKRYIDDQLEILPPINPGLKYCKERAASDFDQPAIRRAEFFREIGISIVVPDIWMQNKILLADILHKITNLHVEYK